MSSLKTSTHRYLNVRASLVVQTTKNLPAMWESRVQYLSQKIPLRKECQPTPVFLPGELHGQKSLVCYNPCGHNRVGYD